MPYFLASVTDNSSASIESSPSPFTNSGSWVLMFCGLTFSSRSDLTISCLISSSSVFKSVIGHLLLEIISHPRHHFADSHPAYPPPKPNGGWGAHRRQSCRWLPAIY